MNEFGLKSPNASVADMGLKNVAAAYWNLTPAELVEETIIRGEGELTDTGALAVDTGEFTGALQKISLLSAMLKQKKQFGGVI